MGVSLIEDACLWTSGKLERRVCGRQVNERDVFVDVR